MDEFIKLLDPAYELIQYRIKENKVIFHIASTITELECPFCGSKTSKVHSIYQREIQDLPMQGKKVILLVDTRKMRCMNPDCSYKTFSEKHPFVTAKSKKTNRLIQNILYTINEQISNFAQTYPTNLKASSNEALLFMRRYRFANCSCFSCCFKDAYPSSNVQ